MNDYQQQIEAATAALVVFNTLRRELYSGLEVRMIPADLQERCEQAGLDAIEALSVLQRLSDGIEAELARIDNAVFAAEAAGLHLI